MRQIRVHPLIDAPIIPTRGQLPSAEHHDNINGPSLIRVPSWVPSPPGAYYLYFADHKGSPIRSRGCRRLRRRRPTDAEAKGFA